MTYRYVPLLRTKAGELVALRNLPAAAKARLFPIAHIVATPPASFATKLAAAWPQEIALDGLFNFGLTGSASVFSGMMRDLRQARVPVIPCIEYAADQQYIAAAKRFITTQHPKLAIKVELAHLATLPGWLTTLGWNPSNVHLVIDAGHVGGYDPAQFAAYVGHAIGNNLLTPSTWLSVTLSSSAAPHDTGALQRGRNLVPRLDWSLWQAVHSQVSFQLDYGDYGISHPDLAEPPGVAMAKATVSVRYTVDDDWIILKGRPITGASGQPMANQYRQHARALHNERQFGQLQGCWGDQRITQIASSSTGGSGSRTTWVEIGANRHLSFIADRLP